MFGFRFFASKPAFLRYHFIKEELLRKDLFYVLPL